MTNYGGKQAEIVMRTFYKHKLRDPGGHTITDPVRAKAVAMREQEAADERGTEIRTFKGRSRRRPKLKK